MRRSVGTADRANPCAVKKFFNNKTFNHKPVHNPALCLTKADFAIPCIITMIIPSTDYNITQNNIPVLTRTPAGTYINTHCWLSVFNIQSEHLKTILSGFDFKNNILDTVRQFGRSPMYIPTLRILTNSDIQTPNFDAQRDTLAVALFLDSRRGASTWLDFFEVNYNYKLKSGQYSENQTYKRVGESALKACQQEYMSQGIDCRSTFDAMNFYMKYGFKRIDERECYLRWGPQR